MTGPGGRMQITGGCHCGAITYEAEIDPEQVSICHCTACQTLTGSPFRLTVIAHSADIRLTTGTPKAYTRYGDNGRARHQHFCGNCGTPLFSGGEGSEADDWGIRWGSIHQRRTLRPRRQLWCGEAVDWLSGIGAIPARPGD